MQRGLENSTYKTVDGMENRLSRKNGLNNQPHHILQQRRLVYHTDIFGGLQRILMDLEYIMLQGLEGSESV